ncbi:MATE efflux family protein [Xylona heveae TC161]|uniref:MATE efflux family protein n=1 Tax=Xylona heveae (strain CBS 132557 / TC161) TaxID=1328760 RepID=A0A164ZUH0_XYLHT|nr:MATE efflux family protein [Xylona heveae TC161]KZF19540.1 MATE efflux family protein [Xylona heveae TC161]
MESQLPPGCTMRDEGGVLDGQTVGSRVSKNVPDLENMDWNLEDWRSAIHGKQVPCALGRPTPRYCVIRGIRYNPGFAKELHGVLPEFTRALNARSIMSNSIPDMNHPDDFPYCIWHPEVATEATYRELAHRYPQLKYHVGRACAVAGYVDLYKELDILPEVHIAEEARSNGHSAIFDMVMANDTIYNVMNDYNRTVDIDSPSPGRLNCDTAVRSLLEIKKKVKRPDLDIFDFGEEEDHDFSDFENFNITEDWNIDDHETPRAAAKQADDLTSYLCAALPTHLPDIDKDLLILMSAYYGDIDRYARLRRPRFVTCEVACVVRGIYHNTMFAKYWSLQKNESDWITEAITARFIMNDDLTRIKEGVKPLPYLIWYPRIASRETYEELAEIAPSMKPAIARVYMMMDYRQGYDQLNVQPDEALMDEAEFRASKNPYYKEDLERKVAGGAKLKPMPWQREICDERLTYSWYMRPRLRKFLTRPLLSSYGAEIYNGLSDPNVSEVERNLCVPPELRFDEDHRSGDPAGCTEHQTSIENELINEAPNETTNLLHKHPSHVEDAHVEEGSVHDPQYNIKAQTRLVLQEFWILIRSSIPVILAYALQNSLQTVSVLIVGRLSPAALATAAFSYMFAMSTAWLVALGGTTALDTLCSSNFTGSQNPHELGTLLQRSFIVLGLFYIPVMFLCLCSEPVFKLLGQDPELSASSARFLSCLAPGGLAYVYFEAMKKYLQAQEIMRPGTYVLLITSPINALLNYLFIHVFHWGLLGAPIATGISYWLSFGLLILYTRFVGGGDCWGGWSKSYVRNMGTFARLAFMGVIQVGTEWWAFEIVALAAARLGTIALAAQSVIMTTDQVMNTIPFSIGVAASSRVGNLLGARNAKGAARAANVAAILSMLFGAIVLAVLMAVKDVYAKIFNDDPRVVKLTAQVLPFVALFQIADGLKGSCGGSLRGMGRQHVGSVVDLLSYYCGALPLGIWLAFHGWGLKGLWVGQCIALYLVGVLQWVIVLLGNWKCQVDKALQRLDLAGLEPENT